MRARKRMIVLLVIAMVIQLISFPAFAEADQDNLAEVEFVGPGKYVADILMIEGGEGREQDAVIGQMSLWNTRDHLWITLETGVDWAIQDVFIYAGDEVPVAEGGAPDLERFNYKEELDVAKHTYEFSLDLMDDLDLTWGQRDELRRIPAISVCIHVEPTAEDSTEGLRYAWGEGNMEFDSHTGWWLKYAITHPSVGHFIDAPVEGVGYQTPTHKGTTEGGGAFNYFIGEEVELFVGGISIGKASADHKITPMDVVGTEDTEDTRVVNMARLLQSLDDDGEPNGGIEIGLATSMAVARAMNEMGLKAFDFSDSEEISAIIERTNAKLGGRLNPVDSVEALENLEKGTSSNMVRKNVSKSSAFEVAKAKLEVMSIYAPAVKANGDPVTLNYYDPILDEDTGEITDYALSEERKIAKPLVTVYAEEVPGTGGFDIYGAVSRDAGSTWQVKNLSKSADKSSFIDIDGEECPGSVKKPQVRVKDNYILVAWTSKFARTGTPRYSLDPGDPYYEEDIWGVSGPQRSRDYTNDGYPEVGELPYSVVWTCRGVIDKSSGEITWYKAERLTSGRRDAYQLMMNGVDEAGFALVWQEDPEGLRPGSCAGPGDGWSGATTSHKTDIWYSYILWDDFEEIDEDFESKGVQKEDINEDLKGRPKAEVPFSLPVRVSDNDTLNVNNMKVDAAQIPGLYDLDVGDVLDVNSSAFVPLLEAGDGTHSYGYAELPDYYDGPEICDKIYYKVNNQNADKYVAITGDGRVLDGNTGASRPNIMLQKYSYKKNGESKTSAWVTVCYEETKGAGSGPDEGTGASEVVEGETASFAEEVVLTDDGSGDDGLPTDIPDQGVGDQKGKYTYTPDEGKLVIYHTFDIAEPDLVSGGEIINPQVSIDSKAEYDYYLDFYGIEDGILPGVIPGKGVTSGSKEEGDPAFEHRGLLYLVDGDGNLLHDFNGDLIPAYENARRPRMIIQGVNAALGKSSTSAPAKWDEGTTMVMLYKMGEEGQGRPSDIMMVRWVVPADDFAVNTDSQYRNSQSGVINPYSIDYLQPEVLNISSTLPTEWAVNDRNEDKTGDGIKVMRWEQPEECLQDSTFTNPYEDARAHRGILRGKNLAIAYDWTPNWAASRNGNAVYNVYLRRSFDGGESFTNNPKGTSEVYIDDEFMGIGTKCTEIFRTSLGSGNERIDEEEVPKETVETFIPKGSYEPARNLSLLQNNKVTVIEPRLVGGPSTTKVNGQVLFGEDQRNTNLFWITYGTCSNPAKDSMEDKVPLDLYYSYTTDFGDSFYEETKTVNPDSQGHYAGQERTTWPWLAKDTGNRQAEQAECQIRMSPDGSTFYAVWNEKTAHGGDVQFRRIMLDGRMIESKVDLVDLTPPVITISGIEDGDVRSEDVSISISLNELGSWEAILHEGTSEDVYTENPIELPASATPKAYELDVTATDLSGNTSFKHIAFTIDGNVPQIDISGVENGEHTKEDVHLEINTYDAEARIELMWQDVLVGNLNSYDLATEGEYELTVEATLDGKTSTRNISFVIDKTPPDIRIDGVEDGETYINSADPHVVVTDELSDHLNELTMLLNGNEYLNSTKITDSGEYTLEVTAVDQAGNTAEASLTFSVEVIGTRYRFEEHEPDAVEGMIHAGKGATILFKEDFGTLQVPVGQFDEDVYYVIKPAAGETTSGRSLKVGDLTYSFEFFNKDGDSIRSFDKPMTLTFAYNEGDLPVGNVESEIQICYRNEALGEWVAIPSTIDVASNQISAEVGHLSVFGVRAVKEFPCLADCDGHWAAQHIYRLASLNIVSGDQNGNYNPEDPINREEMAKILVNALGLEAEGPMTAADAGAVSDWAAEYMRVAVAAGALEADANGNVRPQQNATRQDLIVAAKAVFNLKILNVQAVAFSDLETLPLPLHQTAQVMSQHGIMTGYEDGSIRPASFITRGELAKMISQFLTAQRQ